MTPTLSNLQQRHWDYVLGPNQTGGTGGQNGAFGSVAANAVLQGVPLVTDTDAPFLLRSLAVRVQYDTSSTAHRQTNLNQLQLRFAGPSKNYFQQTFVPLNLLMPFGGQLGNPHPLQRQIYYPPGSSIYVDVYNNGANALTNLNIVFRGVKLFTKGIRPAWTYPPKMKIYPYGFNATVKALAVQGPPVRSIFNVIGGWDFAFRSIQAGVTSSNTTWEVFMRLYDSDMYPYSNDFLHVDMFAGNGTGPATYPTGAAGTFIAPIGPGPSLPGVFYPEIYLPVNSNLLYDMYRLDNGFGTAVAQDFPMEFFGAKVIRQAA